MLVGVRRLRGQREGVVTAGDHRVPFAGVTSMLVGVGPLDGNATHGFTVGRKRRGLRRRNECSKNQSWNDALHCSLLYVLLRCAIGVLCSQGFESGASELSLPRSLVASSDSIERIIFSCRAFRN